MTLPIPYAKTLKVKQITPTIFEVMNHSVKIQTKKGRCLLICSCHNDTRFCLESPICSHKLAVIIYLVNKNLNKNIDKLISDYTKYKDCDLVPSVDLFLSELNNLKNIK